MENEDEQYVGKLEEICDRLDKRLEYYQERVRNLRSKIKRFRKMIEDLQTGDLFEDEKTSKNK